MSDTPIPIDFATQSYQMRSGLASHSRVVNMYAELPPQDSKSRIALFTSPGATIWKAIQDFQPLYGMIVMVDNLYVVCGLNFYRVNSAGTTTLLGTMSTTPDRVMMTENGIQVTILTSSGIAYYWDETIDVFGQITDINYQLSNSVTTLDGYTIFTKKDSERFFISANRDTTSYSALDFASAEADSDNLVVVLNYNRQLFLIGTRTTEVWYNAGSSLFPFVRRDGVLIKRGTLAKFSAVSDMTGCYWLGDDKIIYQISDYQPRRISTHGVEKAIESYGVVEDAFAFIYVQQGHRFYCITFPSEGKTWCYDITTGLWSERESINPITGQNGAWLPNCYAAFANKQLVGGQVVGTIYALDLNNYLEDNTRIIRTIISSTQFDDFRRDSVGRFILWMDTGVGIDGAGQGIHPNVMMRTSVDGGKTWSNELWQPMGDIGEYNKEVWWDQVSYGRNTLFQLNVSDPVDFAITGAFLNVTQGRA